MQLSLIVAIFLNTASAVVTVYEADSISLSTKKSIRPDSDLKEIVIMNENANPENVFGNLLSGNTLFESSNISGDSQELFTPNMALMYSIFSAVLVGLTGILPLLMMTKVVDKNSGNLNRFLSFAVGGLLGDVFLHLLPESWSLILSLNHQDFHGAASFNGGLVLFGLIAFWCFEKFAPGFPVLNVETEQDAKSESKIYQNCNGNNNNKKNDFCYEEKCHLQNSENNVKTNHLTTTKSNVKMTGYLNLLANFIDNFSHGLAIGGSYLVSRRVGILTTGAILLHEIPHEIGDFAILLRAGFIRWEAAKMQLLTSTGGIIGAISVHIFDSNRVVAWILPFTSGGFLYIALCTIVPDLLQNTISRKESCLHVFLIILAIAVMSFVSIFE